MNEQKYIVLIETRVLQSPVLHQCDERKEKAREADGNTYYRIIRAIEIRPIGIRIDRKKEKKKRRRKEERKKGRSREGEDESCCCLSPFEKSREEIFFCSRLKNRGSVETRTVVPRRSRKEKKK